MNIWCCLHKKLSSPLSCQINLLSSLHIYIVIQKTIWRASMIFLLWETFAHFYTVCRYVFLIVFTF